MNGHCVFTASIAAIAVMAASCGYHLGGQAKIIPSDVKTVAIPAFNNGTVRYKVANLLGADVAREFHARTKYQIVTDPHHADAVLNGTVVRVDTLGGITTDPTTGRATSSQIILTLQFNITDTHTGKVLFSRTGYEFRKNYEIADLNSYFDESSTAIRRVSADAAQAIVSAILEAF